MAVKSKAPDAVKLFVGQIPKHLTQEELLPIFEEAGAVFDINIIKDKSTKQSRGCCFLTYSSRSEADNAIDLFHNKKTISPMNSPMQVKYADGELERLEHKLFIGMLPKSVTEAEVRDVFSEYGNIKELQVIKGSQQTAKACAFLKYETREEAAGAVEALNGIYRMEGASSALVVKWADTEKERQARKMQKSQTLSPATNGALAAPLPQQPASASFGPLPLATPQFNGFAYQASTYGIVPYPASSLQNQPLISGMTTGTTQSLPGTLSDIGSGVLTPVQPAGYVNSAFSNVAGRQYPLAYQGALLGQAYAGATTTAVVGYNSTPVAPKAKASITPQAEGPPGANLFIYHIPAEFGDSELSTAFASFGNVISAKVFVDKTTGISKCFGFVSYDSPEAAQSAINVMNGFQLSGKRLKVQLKRDNKPNKPY
ncbi:hypothetical protein SELMODRAFT_442777 [Selaginella moellendorffii]|uniref:RRM domain-containing protein n=1 Tax=Selaginella moellendorffii TaxID=88036 RepID=D8RW01_SELML|nr:hypothetical protein SELMODRAFT_442777 [Selaginella moellendorffii]